MGLHTCTEVNETAQYMYGEGPPLLYMSCTLREESSQTNGILQFQITGIKFECSL